MPGTRNSRAMPLESGAVPLEGGKRIVKFDPTINTGTIIQIATVVLVGTFAVATFKAELSTQAERIETNKVIASRDNGIAVDSLRELKADVKDLQKSVNDMKEGIAILRGRAANTDGGVRNR